MARPRRRDVIGDALSELHEHGRAYCDSQREAETVVRLFETANPGRRPLIIRTDWGRWCVVHPDLAEVPKLEATRP